MPSLYLFAMAIIPFMEDRWTSSRENILRAPLLLLLINRVLALKIVELPRIIFLHLQTKFYLILAGVPFWQGARAARACCSLEPDDILRPRNTESDRLCLEEDASLGLGWWSVMNLFGAAAGLSVAGLVRGHNLFIRSPFLDPQPCVESESTALGRS